jgi:hypothetical protein
MRPGLFLCAMALLGASLAAADAPPLPGRTYEVRSPNGGCLARVDIDTRRVTVSNLSGSDAWTVPGWHRSVMVADDCRSIAIGFDGLNLIGGSDRRPETVIVRFVRRDGPERRVLFGQLYRDPSILPQTVSHYVLHNGMQWDGRQLTIRTVDGRTLRFAP